MTIARSIASGSSLMLVGQWSKFAVQIAGIIVLARILTPGDFGLVAMVTAVIGLATIFADFGLSLAALRQPNMSHQDRSNLFWANLGIGLLASATVALTANLISILYGRPELKNIVFVLCGIFTVQAASSQFRAEISRSLKFHKMVVVDVISQVVATTIAIGAAINGASYWALVIQQLVFAFSQFIGLAAVARWFPCRPRNLKHTTQHFIFGSKASAMQIINYVSSNADTVALGRTWDASTVGVYNQAYMFFKMPVQQLAAPLTQVMVPALSKLEPAGLIKYVGVIQSLLVYALGGLFAVIASISTPLMAVLLGTGWEGVAPVLKILAIGGIFQTMGYVYYWVFVVKDCTGYQLIYGGIARIAMIALIFVLVPWGNNGVALAVTIGLILNWVLLTIFVVPHTGIKRSHFIKCAARPISTILIGFVLISSASHFYGGSFADLQFVIILMSTWLIYFAVAFLVVPILRSDIKAIFRFLKSAKHTLPTGS